MACDRARLAQLPSNLLANAFAHGDPDTPVRVRAATTADAFELAVTNQGPAIPPGSSGNCSSRSSAAPRRRASRGWASACTSRPKSPRGHGGALAAESAAGETCFTFRMPLAAG